MKKSTVLDTPIPVPPAKANMGYEDPHCKSNRASVKPPVNFKGTINKRNYRQGERKREKTKEKKKGRREKKTCEKCPGAGRNFISDGR